MANEFTCDQTGLTGISRGCQPDNTAIVKKFITKYDFQFDTLADMQDETKWDTAIQNEEVFPIDFILETDDNSTEVGVYESDITGNKYYTSEGKTSKTDRILYNPCVHSQLRKFNNQKVRIIEVDKHGNIVGTSPDDTIRKGYECSDFYVGKRIDAANKDSVSFTPIHIDYASVKEREDQSKQTKVDWNILNKNGIQAVTLTVVGTPSSTEIVVDVTYGCSGIGISGFTQGSEFLFLESDGVTPEAVTNVAEDASINGRYTLTGAAFTTGGSINLNGVVALLGEFYKGTAATVTF